MRQIQLHDMGTEGSDLSLLSSPADPTAAQHQHTGDVQTIWGGQRRGWMEGSETQSLLRVLLKRKSETAKRFLRAWDFWLTFHRRTLRTSHGHHHHPHAGPSAVGKVVWTVFFAHHLHKRATLDVLHGSVLLRRRHSQLRTSTGSLSVLIMLMTLNWSFKIKCLRKRRVVRSDK